MKKKIIKKQYPEAYTQKKKTGNKKIEIHLQQGPLLVYLQSSVPLPQSRTSHSPAETS